MNLRFRQNANWMAAYMVIGILGLVITYFISSFVLPFHRYRLICQDVRSKDLADRTQYRFYADLNGDGFSETILLNRITDYRSDPFIEIYDHRHHLLIKKILREQWLYNNWIVGDYDHDSLKEFYIFTRKRRSYFRDSLFLYGIDPFKGDKNFINRVYITSLDRFISRSLLRKPWDINIRLIGFFDADGDGFQDLAFSLNSRSYTTPKKIYVFSLRKQKIIEESKNFDYIYEFKMVKNPSGQVRIYPLLESIDQNFGRADSSQGFFRFFILDKSLRPVFKPREIPTFSHNKFYKMYFYPLRKSLDRFVAQQVYSGKTYFYLIDAAGHVLKSKQSSQYYFPMNRVINYSCQPSAFSPMILFSPNGDLFRIDSALHPQVAFTWGKRQGNIYFRMNIDNDPQLEIIDICLPTKSKYKRLAILQDDLKSQINLAIPHIPDTRRIIFSIKSKRNGSTIFSLSSQNFDGLYLYGLNPYYHLNFFVFFLGFLLISLLLYGIFKLINTLFFYYHFLSRHLNTINKGVLLISFKGKVQHYNQNFVRMLNIPQIRPGMSVIRLIQPYPQIAEIVDLLLSGKKNEVNEELTIQHPDRIFKGRLFGYFLSGMAGIPSGYCLEIYDLSETILTEREEVIARLIRKMAHDIKTPLSTIKFAIEAMRYILPLPEYQKVQEDVSTVVEEVNHIHAIANNYSKFARLSKLNLEVVSIKDIISKVIGSYGYMDTVRVSVNVAPDAEMITADGRQIELLIKEVFENALDAVGNEGDISFETYPVHLGENDQSEAIFLRISDSGIGIPKEIKDRIFEPSFSTKNQGTGFGLVLAQRIVQNHGGKITIDSEEGKGTHVLIILPKDSIEKIE